MMFSSKTSRPGHRALAVAVAALTTALVVACGGGTSQFEPFVAERVVVFGDENSLLTSTGRSYSVNGVSTTDAAVIDCNAQPLWVQQVAGIYGFVYAECNTATPPPAPKAFNRAALGAKVADVAAQVEVQAQPAAGGFRDKDLVLVMAGINDILELYAQYPARTEASLIAESAARGERMAAIVNRMIGLGAKVIVSNLPDMGMSPYARKEAVDNAASGFDRAQLISRLATAFNEQLGIKVLLDGRFVGLVQMDQDTLAASRSPASFRLVDVSTAFCNVAVPDCTTATPVTTGAVASQFLWADAKRLAPGGQNMLATRAIERAQRNPF